MKIRRGYFDGPAGQIHFRVAGERGEPLVLLHQSPLSSTQFEAVMPGLVGAGFHALALDMPGFGMSDAAHDGATLDDYAAIVAPALAMQGWSDAYLVGHHTGAVVAAVHAAKHPKSVRKLVLNGFPVLSRAERDHFATFYFGPKTPQADGSHLITAWQNRLRSTPGWSDIGLMHRYTVEALHRGATNWKAFPLVIGADLEGVLQALQVPTLLFTNTGEDLYDSTRRTHAMRPDFFAYAELQGGSHDIIDEQPDNWVREVVRFLRG
ncbi:MAG: alpha/beta hydrolase [Gammaproteobacteria bacterium]|jgi:pimeloyl-ACP methyl ester carboxylesterase|nr:alpha/beta hydrolase [Gammaproteobacteria bacterium]